MTTRTPWKAQGKNNRPWLSAIVKVTDTVHSPIVTTMATEDAEYIVRCVNSHAPLVAALRAVYYDATGRGQYGGCDGSLTTDTIHKMIAALKAAEEE